MKRKYILKTTDTKRELDMNCNHTIFGIPLLVKDCFVLSLVTKENINKFVYLPTKLHMNDFVPHMDNSKDKIHDKIKLFVIRFVCFSFGTFFAFNCNIVQICTDKATKELWV